MSQTDTDTRPVGQQYYEAIEALKAEGMSNADAIRAVAEQRGKPVNTIRGSLHQYKSRHLNGNGAAPRRRSGRSVEDHLSRARESLQAAMAVIDQEVTAAKTAAEAAQARYEQISESVAERKADIEQKLAALS
jgi:hypothetical protein